jgi:hypothetical protein
MENSEQQNNKSAFSNIDSNNENNPINIIFFVFQFYF